MTVPLFAKTVQKFNANTIEFLAFSLGELDLHRESMLEMLFQNGLVGEEIHDTSYAKQVFDDPLALVNPNTDLDAVSRSTSVGGAIQKLCYEIPGAFSCFGT